VDFVLPKQYRLRNRLTVFPDRIHIHARGASPLDDRLDITAHADEQDWEPGEPSRSDCRDLDVVELDARWAPTWPADVIAWPDFGLPVQPEVAAGQITAAFRRARRGELVEVGCLGGSGRTGTVLACMAVLAGVPPAEAVPWVREAYRREAVETADQEAWVQWFAGWARDASAL
jgi:hypothetical protein